MYVQLDSNNNPVQVIPNVDFFNYYGRTITGSSRLSASELASSYQVYRLVKRREEMRKYEIPSASPPRMELDLSNFLVYEVYSYVLQPHAIIKSDLMEEVKLSRDSKRTEGFAFKAVKTIIDGVEFANVYPICPATRNEQTDIVAIIMAYKTGLKTGKTMWKIGKNCYIEFQDGEECTRFGMQMDAFIQSCFKEEARVCSIISAEEDHQKSADTKITSLFKVDRFIPINHDKYTSLGGVNYYKPAV